MKEEDKISRPGEQKKNIEIMIVEDSAIQAKVLKYFLERAGYAVLVAENGEEGLKLARKRRPSLMISDIKMPVMDGYEMCRTIKRDESLRDLPVILLTVLSDQEDIVKGLDAGADNYITKPYDDKYLLTIVESLLSEPRQERTRETPEGLEVMLAGEKHLITSGRKEILNLLLSTYENAIQQNHKLSQTELALRNLNEHLEEKVKERTAELSAEVAERRKAELELRKLTTAIDHSVNIVLVTDKGGKIEYVNPMFERLTGYLAPEAVGKTLLLLASEDSRDEYEEMWKTARSGGTWRGLLKCREKSGEFRWVNCIVTPIKNERNEITNFLAVQEDMTEKKTSLERIQYLADYDPATGLLNRTRFLAEMNDWTLYTRTADKTCALLVVNLDQFKFINDTYGHNAGDEVLRSVARLLQTTCRDFLRARGPEQGESEVIFSRLGGDEFGLLLPYMGREEALEIAEALRKSIESFRRSEITGRLTASVGIVLYPEHGMTSKELLTRVDGALFRAKENGRNRCHVFRPEDRDLENMRVRLALKERILKALDEDRFVPWYQPIMNIRKNKVEHYEVLARMIDEDGTVLLPSKFIDVAERFGIIGSIDRVIAEKAMKVQSDAVKRGKPVNFALNISGKNLDDHDFLPSLKERISRTGANPNCLLFEITETAAVQDIESATRLMSALKALGCHFSLDDFGVGFTSFVYLKKMNVDYIKIDGSFIKGLDQDHNDQLFVKAITEVARGMGIKTIAEFVERHEILELIKKYNVDFGQGFLFGRPSPAISW